jgi:hypothetical protein
MSDDGSSDDSSDWKAWVFAGVVTIALVAIGLVVKLSRGGTLDQAFPLRNGLLLVALDRSDDDSNSGRLSIYDSHSGQRLARKNTDRPGITFLGQSATRLWFFDGHDGLLGLDTRSLETVVTAKEIIAANPPLSPGLHFDSPTEFTFSPDFGISLMSTDGFRYRMDPESLSAQRVEKPPTQSGTQKIETLRSEATLQSGGKLTLEGNPRVEIYSKGDGGHSAQDPRWQSLSFIGGKFLFDTVNDKLIEPPGPDSFLLVYADRLNNQAVYQLARIKDEGGQLWARPLDAQPAFAELDGDNLLIVDSKGLERINLSTGARIWRQDF